MEKLKYCLHIDIQEMFTNLSGTVNFPCCLIWINLACLGISFN